MVGVESFLAARIPPSFASGLIRASALAGVSVAFGRLLFVMCIAALVTWAALVILMHPGFVISALLLPLSSAGVYGCAVLWLRRCAQKNRRLFLAQLEGVLEMLTGALRVGMGLRQALIVIMKELPEPSRREFGRAVERTTIGISILDALDELALRMPSNEMSMMAKTIRIQAKTGGDLSKILENLAGTIKARRQAFRKMQALTAEGRASAYVIVALPIVVGGFIILTQAQMTHALFFTVIGWITLALVVILEVSAALMLSVIMKFNI